jgi:membrane protein
MRWKDVIGLVRKTGSSWWEQQTFLFGAALAFYAAFALAPLLVIAIALAGIFFGEDAAQGRLDATLEDALGATVARAMAETLTYVHLSGSGWAATAISAGVLLFAVTGMFVQLQVALNAIWNVPPRPGWGLWGMVRGRAFAFLLVLVVGTLLLFSLIVNTALLALRARLSPAFWAGESFLWEGVDWLLSLVLLTLLVAMIYKLLPDAIIAWRNVWVGALITALLFVLGNFLICQYLYWAVPATAYGPAGCLVVVMLWVYYSSLILLFGAEFTKHFADRYTKPTRPAAHAVGSPR